MKTKTTLAEAAGKVLTGHELGWDNLLLVFGEHYVCLEAKQEYGEPTGIQEIDLYINEFDSRELIELGVVSREEVEEDRRKRASAARELTQSRERAEYNRLRKKFEKE